MSSRISRTVKFCSICALPGIIALFAQGTSQAGPDTPDENAPKQVAQLPADPRLMRPVTVTETGISLTDLSAKLSGDGLDISASAYCSPLKMQIRIKHRPLRTVMEAIAELVPGQWKPTSTGYFLEMDSDSVLRRDRWWRLFQQERSQALAAQKAYVLQKIREQPQPLPPLTSLNPNPELSDPAAKAASQAAKDLFRSLPPALQERIADRMIDSQYYSAGSRYPSAPYFEENAVVVRLDEMPERVREIVRQQVATWPTAQSADLTAKGVMLRFNNWGYSVNPTVAWPSGRWGSIEGLPIGHPQEATLLTLDHTELPDIVRRLGKSAPRIWRMLAADQETRFWKNDLPSGVKRTAPPPRRADVLKWLADKADIEFVADYYSTPCRPMQPAERTSPLTRPLVDELNYQAAIQDLSWKKSQDSLYLFRNNRWYRDDYLEAPATHLQRWLAWLSERHQNMKGKWSEQTASDQVRQQLDWEAEVAASLSPWQIANGLRWFVPEHAETSPDRSVRELASCPFSWDALRIMREYKTVRFYGSLTPAQRTALIDNHLSLAELTPAQQADAMDILPTIRALSEDRAGQPISLGVRPDIPRMLLISGMGSPLGPIGPDLHLYIASPTAAP